MAPHIRNPKDLSGLRFGKYFVAGYAGHIDGYHKWICRCDCGKEKILRNEHLIRANNPVMSCGCEKVSGFGKGRKNVSSVEFRIRQVLYGIRSRCLNKNNLKYKDYGGRGISVCDEWMDSPSRFVDWALKNGWTEELTVDRINNNLGYSPENCRLVDHKTQAVNKRNNIKIQIGGIYRTVSQWCEAHKINYGVVYKRMKRGSKDPLFLFRNALIPWPDDPRYTVRLK